MILDPTVLPAFSINCPLARLGNNTWARPVTARGYRIPNITVVTKVNHKAITRFFFISSSHNPQVRQQHVDQLDSEKRRDNSAYSVNQEIALQQSCRTQ